MRKPDDKLLEMLSNRCRPTTTTECLMVLFSLYKEILLKSICKFICQLEQYEDIQQNKENSLTKLQNLVGLYNNATNYM
jgi:c-di-GMP-related signal transduction protein